MCYSCKRVFRGLTLTNQYLKVGSFKKKEFGRIKYQLRLILKAFHSLGNAIALLYLLFNYWLVSPDNQPNDQTDYPCNQYDNQPQYATLSPLFGISIHQTAIKMATTNQTTANAIMSANIPKPNKISGVGGCKSPVNLQ